MKLRDSKFFLISVYRKIIWIKILPHQNTDQKTLDTTSKSMINESKATDWRRTNLYTIIGWGYLAILSTAAEGTTVQIYLILVSGNTATSYNIALSSFSATRPRKQGVLFLGNIWYGIGAGVSSILMAMPRMSQAFVQYIHIPSKSILEVIKLRAPPTGTFLALESSSAAQISNALGGGKINCLRS